MKRLPFAGGALAALALAGLGTLAAAPAAVAAGPSCPTGDTVVNLNQTVLNDDDAGVAGNAWASTTYARNIVVIRTGAKSFCAYAVMSGKFATNPGTSPGATGLVEGSLTGTFIARWTSNVFTAKFRPSMPTSGTLPPVDFACDPYFNCKGFVDWMTYYFTDVSGFGLVDWRRGFDGGTYGVWYDLNGSSFYDITG
jgi:hypothetical protein